MCMEEDGEDEHSQTTDQSRDFIRTYACLVELNGRQRLDLLALLLLGQRTWFFAPSFL